MAGDGDDVLGNLPRARPGKRSEKRSGRAQAARTKRPDTGPRSKPAGGSRGKRAARARPSAKAEAPRPGGDPVRDGVRAAGKVAEAGLRVASGVTREVLRRLPRP